jgi:2-amino-4-hydroxy-6-hydroxymethyldihydropteridine diphosphokinase
MDKQRKAHLLTGSNIGDRLSYLQQANRLIHQRIGPIAKLSSFYETAAWGKVSQPDYINQALEVVTVLSPEAVMSTILSIETEIGRTRWSKWEARVIDIDILFYENRIIKTEHLIIPHPLLHKRNFALVPMLEIAARKKHPIFKKSIEELYEESSDPLDVIMLEAETT